MKAKPLRTLPILVGSHLLLVKTDSVDTMTSWKYKSDFTALQNGEAQPSWDQLFLR